MDTSKEEIVNLRKQINRLKISLMFTQVLMIALLLILGYMLQSRKKVIMAISVHQLLIR